MHTTLVWHWMQIAGLHRLQTPTLECPMPPDLEPRGPLLIATARAGTVLVRVSLPLPLLRIDKILRAVPYRIDVAVSALPRKLTEAENHSVLDSTVRSEALRRRGRRVALELQGDFNTADAKHSAVTLG